MWNKGAARQPPRDDPAASTRRSAACAPRCGGCAAAMLFIGALPRVRERPRLDIFACRSCRSVAAINVEIPLFGPISLRARSGA